MAQRISRIGILIASAALLAFATPARADFFETFSATVPLQNTDYITTVGLQQFQPQGNEQLLGVTLSLDGNISSKIDLTFNTLSTLSLNADALISVTRPDGVSLSVDPTAPASQTLANQTYSTTLTATASNSLAESTSPVLLSAFTGSGLINLTFKAKGGSHFFSDTGNGGGGVVTQAGGIVTVTYRATPEPASMLLLGFGAVGLGFSKHLRRKRIIDPLSSSE